MGLPAWVRGLYRPVMRLDSVLLTSLLNRVKVTDVQFFIAGASKSTTSTRHCEGCFFSQKGNAREGGHNCFKPVPQLPLFDKF